MGASMSSQLLSINHQLSRYELPFILLIGILTNTMNLLIFSRRAMRQNICSWYFLCLSLIHLLILVTMCSQTALPPWTGYNIAGSIVAFCKIRQYLFDLLTSLSRHFICLISIDRWMITSTNVWLRRQSSPRIARWIIVISVMFWSLFNIHALVEFNIVSNICTASTASMYFFFYSIYSIIITISPMMIMILFSILTLENLHRNRVVPIASVNSIIFNPMGNMISHVHSNPQQRRRRSQRDIHLIRLSVIQVVAFLIFNSIWTMFPLHLFITSSRGIRTLEERLLSGILSGFGLNLIYTYATVYFFFSQTIFHSLSLVYTCTLHISFNTISQRIFDGIETNSTHYPTTPSNLMLTWWEDIHRLLMLFIA